jgi:hypothetical protein
MAVKDAANLLSKTVQNSGLRARLFARFITSLTFRPSGHARHDSERAPDMYAHHGAAERAHLPL